MKKGQNDNRPAKGSHIKVNPIKDVKDIKAIKKMLADKPGDLRLSTLGINTNLRASDLLRITAAQVDGMNPGDELEIKEKKTGKSRRINLNKACIKAIEGLLNQDKHEPEDILFIRTARPIDGAERQPAGKAMVQGHQPKG